MILEMIFRGFFSGNQMEEDRLLVEINDKIHFFLINLIIISLLF